ncbi:DUF3836 domain-containing protein [uncultured Dysgonomonas sp.]|uniref:DUF3836 domain-containing protein n=1 Tax=uncultured Dysgonomonas sp. TaxID=206096 RepID=A0A212JQU0_9BACT|nr:DUF3836 domain-containing protein [uncultured Dysgonomonas sp.]SBW01787.1 conserved exported hypothetical protein [uncultured Dysgonomonas sp.]
MKTTILTSVFAVLVSIMNLNAKDVITYSNMENNELGVKKEYVTLDDKTSIPFKKTSYFYDEKGRLLERTIQKWNDKGGWINLAKFEYRYNKSDKASVITITKWNNKQKDWANKSSIYTYIYNDSNEFLSIKQETVDNKIKDELLTQK